MVTKMEDFMNLTEKRLIKLLQIQKVYKNSFDCNLEIISIYMFGYTSSQMAAGLDHSDPFSKELFFNKLDLYIREIYNETMTQNMYNIVKFYTTGKEESIKTFYSYIDSVLSMPLDSYVQSLENKDVYKTIFPLRNAKINTNRVMKLIKNMKKRPGVYLGEKSFTRLVWFLKGYIMSEVELHQDNEPSYTIGSFEEYLNENYGYENKDWIKIIWFHGGTEVSAFDLFFENLSTYINISAENQ